MVSDVAICFANEAFCKKTTFNNMLYREVCYKLFYSLNIMFFLQILFTKALKLLFIFIRVCDLKE